MLLPLLLVDATGSRLPRTAAQIRCPAADYAGVLKRISEGLAIGVVTQSSLVRIGAGYMGLVFLAVLISSLSLRYQLIYYKQRRSKVSLPAQPEPGLHLILQQYI